MKIRPLEKTDRKIWEAFFSEYAAFYKTSVPEGGYDRVWEWIFDPKNDFWCDLGLSDDGTPIGFTQYQLMHRSLGGAMVCYISDIYIRPEARGAGGGAAFIEHVRAFARSRNVSNVRWLTQEFNYPARRVYDRFAPKSDFILYSIPA